MKAGEMFAAGKSRAEVSRETGVSRHSVHDWYRACKEGGVDGLRSSGKPGREARFSDEEVAQVGEELFGGIAIESLCFRLHEESIKASQVIRKARE